MCDFSLEMYKSRPARQGETLTLRRFASGSMGFVPAADGDKPTTMLDCAVCCGEGVEITLTVPDMPEPSVDSLHPFWRLYQTARRFEFMPPGEYEGIFAKAPDYILGLHRDGLILKSRAVPFVSLQWFIDGTTAVVTKELPIELREAVERPLAFEPEIPVGRARAAAVY